MHEPIFMKLRVYFINLCYQCVWLYMYSPFGARKWVDKHVPAATNTCNNRKLVGRMCLYVWLCIPLLVGKSLVKTFYRQRRVVGTSLPRQPCCIEGKQAISSSQNLFTLEKRRAQLSKNWMSCLPLGRPRVQFLVLEEAFAHLMVLSVLQGTSLLIVTLLREAQKPVQLQSELQR
jgi:hypothetical protein